MEDFYSLSALNCHGEPFSFEKLRGKVVLIVNVASLCGFTPQYSDLQDLYKKYHEQGFEILAFPCNQFGGQEPAANGNIQNFVRDRFGVTFSMMSKVIVNGDDTHPVYRFLKDRKKGALGFKGIRWNFEKFLIDKDGQVVYRFGSAVKPSKLEPIISELLHRTP
ncbi:Glutathione peroxidase-like peroxiredoxin HYR1 [Clavispora lusitaniae]|uniref:Glutathione peroxidase n=1 Tax=Clavispora lusitaniae TaxID=36911 RepID=A0AA91Q5B8_CLALS|nr:Glutathione peroxidase-like peroxiredoxin HYR1 [Clavispora lusitaniae]OVF10963.1 putative glutathione peroxidase [Clavispora lusitaniae]